MLKQLLATGVLITSAGVASAAVTGVSVENVPNSDAPVNADTNPDNDIVTNDINIDFDGLWTGSQMRIQLTQGSIYQETVTITDPVTITLGGNTPTGQDTQDTYPELKYDSYMTGGTTASDQTTANESTVDLLNAGGAVDLGGESSFTFNSNEVNAQWSPNIPSSDDNRISDMSDFLTARISLSEDAEGTWQYLGATGGSASEPGSVDTFGAYSISGGEMQIPEPASAALLGLGGLTMMTRRRKA